MRWLFSGALFLLSLTLVVPSQGGDDKKKDDDKGTKKVDPKKIEPKEKFTYGSKFIGKLTKFEKSSERDFTVAVVSKIAEPDINAQNRMRDLQQRLFQHQVELKQARSNQARQNAINAINSVQRQILDNQKNLVRFKESTKNYDLRAAENMKVRTLDPPLDYDDKGNLKKYSPKELAALKGPLNLPGYTAEFDALRPGQMVEVYLVKSATPTVKGKKKDDLDELGSTRAEVVMILVLQEPQGGK